MSNKTKKLKNKIKYKQSKGITLIALVISIIVLLILAGVTIASLTGDNGLLARAVSAKDKTERAEVIEKVKLEILGGITGNKGEAIDEDGIIDILTKFFKEDSIPEDLTDMTATLTTLDEKFNDITLGELIGDVTIAAGSPKLKATKDGTEVKLSSVSDSEISTYYGAETSYKSISHPNIKWQLFLTDASNYYLIASDYVPTNELPCSGNTINGVTYGSTDLLAVDGISDSYYKARFCSSNSYNDGVLTEGTDYKNGSESNAIKNNPLTSTYLKWVTTYNTSKNNNICAVVYMMDTTKWQSFADGVGASYAIGGPTIEMLSLSWNAVPGHTQMTRYDGDNITSNINNQGYIAQSPEIGSSFFGTTTNMWFIKGLGKANGYWLAAPSSHGADFVRRVYHGGGVDSTIADYNSNGGFRPVVVVPK